MDEMQLIERESMFPTWVLYALLVAVGILALVKLWRPVIFQYITASFVKPPSTIPYSRENLSFFGRASWMLLLNYFVVAGISISMVSTYYDFEQDLLIFAPTFYFLFQAISLFMAGGVSGELKKLNEHFLLLNFTYHTMGLLLIPLLLIWLLNVNYSIYFIYTLAILFSVFWLLRVFRGIFFALRNNILWYYIILYLCTLEIWPLVAFYVLLIADFKR